MQQRSAGAVYPHGINAQAKLLGVDGETGTLAAGNFADIVAVPGDVLRDIRATEKPVLMIKQGVVVRNSQ